MAKTRKTYTAEYKLQGVRMVTDQHLAVAEVVRRLGITEGRLREWLQAFRSQGTDAFSGHGRLAPRRGTPSTPRRGSTTEGRTRHPKKAAADFASHST